MRSTRTIAVALLGAAAITGPASAMPIDPPHRPGRPPVGVQSETSSGFHWASAGIGAAGGVGAFAIALAATGGVRRRRLPGPVVSYAPTRRDSR
jgi:hypothetical protein